MINPTITGIIGPGVVVHLPSFFNEVDALQAQGQLAIHSLNRREAWLTLVTFAP